MRVLVVGSGAREHALCAALVRDPQVSALGCAPGNPGVATVARCLPVQLGSVSAIADAARRFRADLVVVGPEGPLVAGAADAVRARGIACFGPSAAAARVEGSKAFAKEVMASAGVPTAMARVFTAGQVLAAQDCLAQLTPPYVVKCDGLAAGKGVTVTTDLTQARRAVEAGLQRSGDRILLEDFLDGPEASVFALTDGADVRALLPAQDFKRVGAGDTGPNTGGMGAYTPLDWAPPGLVDEIRQKIVAPTLDELRDHRGTPFVGALYVGVALTAAGPRVVEFNARFGDPETQAVLALLDTPLGGLLAGAASGRLAAAPVPVWRPGAAITVVLASPGYPGAAQVGLPITGLRRAGEIPGVEVFHAGTALSDGQLVSSGGRVLAVTGTGADLQAARERVYEAVACIGLPGAQFRPDIAVRAMRGQVRIPQFADEGVR